VERRQLGGGEQKTEVILFLFLTHLGIGIFLTLLFVAREAGVKFFRFNAGLAAILIAVAIAFRPAAGEPAFARLAFGALAVAEAALIVYWATVGRALASTRPLIVALGCIAGVVALGAQAIALPGDRAFAGHVITVASFLSSAVFLGGACTAMILGHWYLVIPSMQVSHLQSIVKVHIASIVARVAVVTAAVVFAMTTWQPGLGPSFTYYLTTADGAFFWMRILFGLAGPAVLSYLTWETAKIRSTQSATGILYVDFFFVLVGEVVAKYVLLATRVPV
jgi:protein NrfD